MHDKYENRIDRKKKNEKNYTFQASPSPPYNKADTCKARRQDTVIRRMQQQQQHQQHSTYMATDDNSLPRADTGIYVIRLAPESVAEGRGGGGRGGYRVKRAWQHSTCKGENNCMLFMTLKNACVLKQSYCNND